MKKLISTFIAIITTLSCLAGTYNIRNFGAKGDGKAIDSPAFNKAIEAAAKSGGGTVLVPAGNYLCYSVRLKSHITLQFESGARMIAAPTTEKLGYDEPEENKFDEYQDFGHSHWKNSLIWGIGLEDVTICGRGFIDGSNLSNGFGLGVKGGERKIALDYNIGKGYANKAISLKECKNVVISDITMYRCGHFCLLATGVDYLTLRDVTVDSNRDGFDIDCCYGVHVSNCTVNTPFDDGIVLKATYALGYYKDTEHVTITNCNVSGFEVGTLLDQTRREPQNGVSHKDVTRRSSGRVKLGTESSGGFKNIAVSNCAFDCCGGLLVETTDGGDCEDITFNNITMRNCSDAPIFVMIGNRLRSPEGRGIGHVRRVRFSNINAWNSNPRFNVIITGYKDNKIEDISLRDIYLHTKGGLTPADAEYQVVPETESRYPDPKLFGTMPTRGMFLRHIDGIRIDGMHFSFAEKDTRQLIMEDDVKHAVLNNVTE